MILAPAIVSLSPRNWPLAVLAACVVPLVFWLYPGRDLRGTSPLGATSSPGWWLATLRSLVVALLALAVLQPTVSMPDPRAARPRLIVLVDDSLSMGTVDAMTSVAERVRIADAIGLIPDGLRLDPVSPLRAGLDELRRQLQALDELQEEIDYAQLVGRDTEPQEARLQSLAGEYGRAIAQLVELAERDTRLRRAAERLRSLPDVDPERVERSVRGLEQVEQALRAIADEADAELAARDSRVADAAARVAGASRLQLANLAIEQPTRGLRARLASRYEVDVRTTSGGNWSPSARPRGTTDLHAALKRVRGEIASDTAGVLLLSDGRQTEPSSPTVSSMPTWAVRIGSASPRRDPSLARVALGSSSRPGQPLLVRAAVQLPSPREETATLRVSHAEQVVSRTVRVPANARQATLELTLPAPTTLAAAYPVVVELETSGDDETRENNRAVFPVEPRPPLDVTLVGPVTRRDVRCLDAWLDQPAYRVRRVGRSIEETGEVEIEPALLRQTTTLILADVGPDDLSGESWRHIEEAVRRDGLTIVLLCGDPPLLRGLGRGEASRWLLPVEPPEAIGWRSWSGESPGFRVIADRPHGVPAMIDLDPEENRRRWLTTPRFFRFISLPSLPADATAWLREIDTQSPLLASWQHGRGEVRWLGLTETWRWRTPAMPEDVQSALFRSMLEPSAGRDPGEADAARAHVAENERLRELADLSADPAGLSRVVGGGPGGVVGLQELPALIDRLLAGPPPPVSRRVVPLWSSWPWLAICVGALTLEWSLRKRLGLV